MTDLVPIHPPTTELQTKLQFADELARADLLPAAYKGKPANVLVAIEYGAMLDLHPLTAIAQVHVIDGKPTQSAELMRAQVARAGHKFRTIEMTSERAVCEIVRADDPDFPTRVEFNVADARAAGLLDVWWEKRLEGGPPWKELWVWPGDDPPPATTTRQDLLDAGAPEWVANRGVAKARRRDPWFQHRRAMLHARCTSAVVRAACPEVLMGVSYTPEELGATVNADGEVIEVREVVEQQGPTREQMIADSAAHLALKDKIMGTLQPDERTKLSDVWKESRFPILDHMTMTVGQIEKAHEWITQLVADRPADAGDEDQAGGDDAPADEGSGPDDPGTDADTGDPEQAEGGDPESTDGSDAPPAGPPPPVEGRVVDTPDDDAAAADDPPADDPPEPPRRAQVDAMKIAERVFGATAPDGMTPAQKRAHVEERRHLLTRTLTQGRTESTSDLDDKELGGLVQAMIAIENGDAELHLRATTDDDGEPEWVFRQVPARARAAGKRAATRGRSSS